MYIFTKLSRKNYLILNKIYQNKKYGLGRCASTGCSHLNEKDISTEIKQEIEQHWAKHVRSGDFNLNSTKPKQYVLSMFPYPSGFLHMGHVRVYTISDAMARFYKLNGMNVIHPMGWDAFGLPAENAAIQRKVSANSWTQQNIVHMKSQLNALGCAFDWNHELSTCDPEYYRWTQKLFLMLFNENLAYQKEALVNWDPVDMTVLADEQVDATGCSWRSGAEVQKKLLKQWFVKTTKFAENLYTGLGDPFLEDWKDIVKLQKHWIGECDGFSFEFPVNGKNETITIWTRNPLELNEASFIGIKSDHFLAKAQNVTVTNPIHGFNLPVVVNDDFDFPEGCDTYLGSGSHEKGQIKTVEEILHAAQKLRLGGFKVSSKLKDWLISRQRYWGTPIPIIHCNSCGPVPVPEADLPVKLPDTNVGQPLSQSIDWMNVTCPKCGGQAKRETDTMDTFVDSSWYFLRFLDSTNKSKIFDPNHARKFMPVDLYVGGKEHAVLHLYYARFINHFLHSLELVPHPEPFKRLLVQGMVMGQSYRVKNTGKYITEAEVEHIDAKKVVEKTTQKPVITVWEKMSKSKYNGVDPEQVINELGCDSLRLIMLADVAPTSHRNWSAATFPGILMWQNRIWLTVNEFLKLRNDYAPIQDLKLVEEHEERLLDARNFYVAGVTFNYKHSHQLSVAISKMQGLTNAIRKSSKDAITHTLNYERALMSLLIMIAPMAPHFASEMWSRFLSAPHRKNTSQTEIDWNSNVLLQRWPEVDHNHELSVTVKVNCIESISYKFPRHQLDALQHEDVLGMAMSDGKVLDMISNINITSTKFDLYPGCHGLLNIFLDQPIRVKKEKKRKVTNN